MSLLLIHLSDIHIGEKGSAILSKHEAIAAGLNGHLATAKHIVIIVSGDIANTGSIDEYASAEAFLTKLADKIKEESRADVQFVISPGNHDCNFKLNNATRDNNIAAVQRNDAEIDASVIESCISIQKPFFDFRANIEGNQFEEDDGLWRTTKIDVGGKTVQFDALNVSWTSKIREDKALFFPIKRYVDKEFTECDARFIVLHHPLNWYNQAIYRPFRKLVRQISSAVITGHEHLGNVGVNDEQESDASESPRVH